MTTGRRSNSRSNPSSSDATSRSTTARVRPHSAHVRGSRLAVAAIVVAALAAAVAIAVTLGRGGGDAPAPPVRPSPPAPPAALPVTGDTPVDVTNDRGATYEFVVSVAVNRQLCFRAGPADTTFREGTCGGAPGPGHHAIWSGFPGVVTGFTDRHVARPSSWSRAATSSPRPACRGFSPRASRRRSRTSTSSS